MGGLFDLDNKEEDISILELKLKEDNFWDNVKSANEICAKLSNLKKEVKEYHELLEEITIMSLLEDDSLITELDNIKSKVKEYEIKTLLNNEFDNLNCYLEIHPGAGGTESCDWASMLMRMYTRFCEIYNYDYKVVDIEDGEEAGIKSCVIHIKGSYAYGYLKNEQGVHRLVRISPFDSNKRRHTSFASVSITPEFNNDINIEIKDADLKIDVYHSSGAGGQSVNTSNSAVRITHIPSKTVVTCQTERSQLLNKEEAMSMLKNKLYQLELDNQNKLANSLKDNTDINFGSQIRSYILEPYKLVKDYRSNYESTNPSKILDGYIKEMIESTLTK